MARHIMDGDDIASPPTDLARQTQYPVLFRYLRLYMTQSLAWQSMRKIRSLLKPVSSYFTNENYLANEKHTQKRLEKWRIV
jgi:hypothetical protein